MTLLEARLIARADAIVRIYHLGGPTGQRSYSGNVISMPKQLNALVNTIPRLPADCDIFMINQEINDEKHKDFIVRRWALKLWIEYLLKFNDAYADVQLNEKALDSYSTSIEGEIPDGIKRINDPNLLNILNNIIDKENKKSKNNVYSGRFLYNSFLFISLYLFVFSELFTEEKKEKEEEIESSEDEDSVRKQLVNKFAKCSRKYLKKVCDGVHIQIPNYKKLTNKEIAELLVDYQANEHIIHDERSNMQKFQELIDYFFSSHEEEEKIDENLEEKS